MPPRALSIIPALALLAAACSGAPPPAPAPATAPPAPAASPPPTAPVARASTSAPAPQASSAPAPEESPDEVPAAPPQPVVLVPAHGPLRLEVKVEPSDHLSVEDARDFYLSIDVANPSRRAIAIDMTQSVLQVNGKPLKQWKGTAASLPTDGKWRDLLPGQSVHFLFKFANKVKVAPGEYGFVLRVGESNSATVKLEVHP